MAQLTREQDRLKSQLDKALMVIDVQKNSASLGNPIDETGDLAVMAAVHELSPVLGAGAAGRAMGLPRGAPAQHRTWMRRAELRRTPAAPPSSTPAAVGARCPGGSGAARHPQQRTLRRHRPGGRACHAARRGSLPRPGAHDVPAAGGQWRLSRAAQPAHPSGLRPRRSCSPSPPTRSGPGISTLLNELFKWTCFHLYVILDMFSRHVG